VVSVYNFDSYKGFLQAWMADRPKKGRGEARKIAGVLGLSSTMISQILNGDKHLTAEAASGLCDYLGLAEKDADHFCLLVDHARAGTHGLKTRLKRKIKKAQTDAQKLKERMTEDFSLTDAEAAVYYSHWAYTGASHLIPCEPTISTEQLAERLQLPLHMMTKVINFLLQSGLVVSRDGRLETGFKHIHLGADSPLVVKHHLNWRLRAFDRMPYSRDADLFLTAPMTLSREVADQVRSELPSFIEKIVKWVGPSESEVVRCLNIDWFDYEKR
jgi:uncharacterized protein (TIGR02147 family)